MTVTVRPWDQISADLRGRNGTAPLSIQGEAAVAGDALAAEVARLSGADVCEVCGSTSPAVRNIMPDNVGRRLFPDVPDVHEMACYWDPYHDPQKAIATVEQVVAELASAKAAGRLRDQIADLDEAIAKELAAIHATLPTCPRCGGAGTSEPVFSGSTIGYVSIVCSDCGGTGKVTVEQLAATWQAVHDTGKESALIPVIGVRNFATKEHHGASVMLDHLRSVRPAAPSPKEGP